jgi:macrolide transport system ATP-binding/permease protein
MHSVLQDLRYGLRAMAANPGFTVVAVLTLALGIGANTAIFSYVDATWLRPAPVRNADRLVKVFTAGRNSTGTVARGESSYQDYLDIGTQATLLEDVVAYEHRGAQLHRPGEIVRLQADTVSPNYFTALGASAALGRTFTEADTEGGRFPVVISYALWQQQFGADPAIAGKEIQLTNGMVNITGVMPRHFRSIDLDAAPAVWIPAPTWAHITGDKYTFSRRGSRRQTIVARLRRGADLNQAQAELTTIAARLGQAYPDVDKQLKLSVEAEKNTRGDDNRRQGWVLLGISGMVLLIACANVANLLLARAEARRKEFATRVALGGSTGRLVRQLLTESLLLAALGLAVALLLGQTIIGALPRLFAAGFSGTEYDFMLDGRVLLFTIAVAIVAVVLFGVVPGLRAARVDLISAIKGTEVTMGHERRLPLRDLLVAGQVALSVLLLVGAGLLVRSFFKAQAVDPGFNPRQNMLLVDLVPGLAGYEQPQRLQNYYRTLLEHMNAMPGVEKAALAVRIPFAPKNQLAKQDVLVPGTTPPPGERGYPVSFTWVGPDYFSVIGTRLLQGRAFGAEENANSQPVAIVNQTMAKRFWPAGDAVGKPLQVGTGEVQVVGVVEDAKWNSFTEQARPILYLCIWQRSDSEATLLLRTQGDPAALVSAVRQELIRVDPKVPMLSSTSLKQHIDFTLNTERSRALLSSAFGSLGLLLAAAGIYGVLSYFITRKTREIGVRMALGAPRTIILAWVLRRGMRLVAIGMIAGLVAAVAASRALAGLLFGIRPTDPLTLAAVAAVLALVGVAAIYIPARRASSVDPMEALRDS